MGPAAAYRGSSWSIHSAAAQGRRFWAMGPAAAYRGSSWSIHSAAAQGRSITVCFSKRLSKLSVQSTVLSISPTAAQGRSIRACVHKRLFELLGVPSIS
jgi:hypothetical protein